MSVVCVVLKNIKKRMLFHSISSRNVHKVHKCCPFHQRNCAPHGLLIKQKAVPLENPKNLADQLASRVPASRFSDEDPLHG